MGVRASGTLVFDGDCRICSTLARASARILGPRGRVVPFQRADLAALGLTRDQAAQAVWWVDAGGHRARGHVAAARALVAADGVWAALGRALDGPVLGPAAARVYAWVARNRHRLPGGTPACGRA